MEKKSGGGETVEKYPASSQTIVELKISFS